MNKREDSSIRETLRHLGAPPQSRGPSRRTGAILIAETRTGRCAVGASAQPACFLLFGPRMPTTITREDDRTYRLEIRGLLKKAELDRAQRELLDTMADDGARTVRLLVRLEAFEGWQTDPRWNDLSFYIGHGDALERIAIVGDRRWQGEALMFAAADLRKGPVEFFTPELEPEARAWLVAAG